MMATFGILWFLISILLLVLFICWIVLPFILLSVNKKLALMIENQNKEMKEFKLLLYEVGKISKSTNKSPVDDDLDHSFPTKL